LVIGADHAGGVVDDDIGADIADGGLHLFGQVDIPTGQVPLIGPLLAQVNMHDRGTCFIGTAGFGSHFGRCDRNVMLFRVCQNAVDGTGDDRLGHDASLLGRI